MAKGKPQVEELEVLIERCAGIDVGQAEVVVCARIPGAEGRTQRLIETFGTTVPDVLALGDWLGVTDGPRRTTSPTDLICLQTDHDSSAVDHLPTLFCWNRSR